MAKSNSSKVGVAKGLDSTPSVSEIALDMLIPYKNHCFRLYEGERLAGMVSSIEKNGVFNPIIVRNTEGGKYEILSGHNRVYAAGSAGLTKVPAYIKYNLSDEDALLYVIESNICQRSFSELRVSERAYAISVRYSKLFDERRLKAIEEELYYLENGGRKPDGGSAGTNTRGKTAEEYGISQATVARLLRINTLIPEIKELVDSNNIKIRSAVDLSYLSEKQQKMLCGVMREMGVTVIDMAMAKQLKEIVNTCASVTKEHFEQVLNGTYADTPKKEKAANITIRTATYNRYLSKYSKKEQNDIIEKALAAYFENEERLEK
ncbi:MAG: ParB N-terminal domain-containing protein [Ruminococcus flavefaciens]|nr:ParB N-terminal domain-containing protein [Ruminococcus flavefaciens]